MSEAEKKQRAEYQRKRTRQIYIRSIFLVLLVLAVLLCGMTANRLSQNSYIAYNESGVPDYQVYLKDNEFYTQEYLTEDYAYIAVLVDKIQAKLQYTMQAEGRAEYQYSYYVDARLEITDKSSGATLYDPVYELVEEKSGTSSNTSLKLAEEISLDYHTYDSVAREFVEAYELDKPVCRLVVTMHVNLKGTCPNVNGSQGNFNVSLVIPMNQPTLKIESNTTVPQQKMLACNTDGVMKLTLVGGGLCVAALLWAVLLVVYIIRTRDRHINYSRQVKKILSSYKSYIQCIKTPLDTSGYQMLQVATFPELLEIRDTLQMPILMYENEDRTCTKFMVPSDAGIVYGYEVCVLGFFSET